MHLRMKGVNYKNYMKTNKKRKEERSQKRVLLPVLGEKMSMQDENHFACVADYISGCWRQRGWKSAAGRRRTGDKEDGERTGKETMTETKKDKNNDTETKKNDGD